MGSPKAERRRKLEGELRTFGARREPDRREKYFVLFLKAYRIQFTSYRLTLADKLTGYRLTDSQTVLLKA